MNVGVEEEETKRRKESESKIDTGLLVPSSEGRTDAHLFHHLSVTGV